MPTILAEFGTHAFIHLTLLGNEGFLYISFIILISLMLYLRQNRAAILLIGSGLSTAAITHFLKASFMVARPEIVLVPPTSFAYPSGHSSGSTVFYGLIAAFVAQTMAKNQRWKCYLLFFVPMALIALSRVMLSVHWFSDVIGGVLLGLMICGLSRTIYSRYISIDRLNLREANEIKRATVIATFAWLLAGILFQFTFFEQALVDYQLLAR